MQMVLLVPFVLGVAVVLQATLNRQIAAHTGLAVATVLNMLVAAGCAFAFALWCGVRGDQDGFLRWHLDLSAFRVWWLVPGIVGFLIVLGLPWSVQRIGALSTFVMLVGAQMLASALWDRFAGGIPLSPSRILGALCTVAGVVLLARTPTS
jgi:bacterial/archaeal transporter family-2 protein